MKKKVILYICILILQLCVLGNFGFNHIFYSAMYESDAASELLLAEEIAKEGHWIFADNWHYSTEVDVLHNQLTLVPLFALTQDYRTTIGCYVVIMALYWMLSVCFLLRSLDVSWENCLLGCILVAVPYGSYCRYSPFAEFLGVAYYGVYLCLSFIWIGLWYRMKKQWENRKKQTVLSCCFMVLSFLLGCCGVRFLLFLIVPACLFELFVFILPKLKSAENARAYFSVFVSWVKDNWYFVAAILLHFIGIVVYTFGIQRKYGGNVFFSMHIETIENMVDRFRNLILGIIQFAGCILDGGPVGTVVGLCQLGALIYVGYLFMIWIRLLKKETDKTSYLYFILFQFIVNDLLLLWVEFDMGATTRYEWFGMVGLYLLPVFWLEKKKDYHNQFVAVMACICILLVNDACLTISTHPDSTLATSYNETGFRNLHRNASADQREGYISFLKENGYQNGYATFWNSNVSTVLADGDVRLINVMNDEAYTPYCWLTYKEQPQGEFVLLLNAEEAERYEKGMEIPGTAVYRDDMFVVYDIR